MQIQKLLQVFLDGGKVVAVFFQKGVVESVAQISVAAVGEFGQAGESGDSGEVVGSGRNEGEQGA